MILNEFTSHSATKLEKLTQALAENYDYDMNLSNMTMKQATNMGKRAKKLAESNNDINKRIKFKMIAESLDLWMEANVQTELTDMVAEGIDGDSVEEAKVILAAREITDKIQSMIEDTAKMQVQDLLPIVDAMKSEIGQAEGDSFSQQADAALANLVEALKSAKEEYDSALAIAQGEDVATDMDDFEMDADFDDTDMSDEGDVSMEIDDEFAGDDATVGGDEPTGREMKDEI